jgi:hypothetical protein
MKYDTGLGKIIDVARPTRIQWGVFQKISHGARQKASVIRDISSLALGKEAEDAQKSLVYDCVKGLSETEIDALADQMWDEYATNLFDEVGALIVEEMDAAQKKRKSS